MSPKSVQRFWDSDMHKTTTQSAARSTFLRDALWVGRDQASRRGIWQDRRCRLHRIL